MITKKQKLESRLGELYTKLSGKPWKNTSKQIEEFSKWIGTAEYKEAKTIILEIFKLS